MFWVSWTSLWQESTNSSVEIVVMEWKNLVRVASAIGRDDDRRPRNLGHLFPGAAAETHLVVEWFPVCGWLACLIVVWAARTDSVISWHDPQLGKNIKYLEPSGTWMEARFTPPTCQVVSALERWLIYIFSQHILFELIHYSWFVAVVVCVVVLTSRTSSEKLTGITNTIVVNLGGSDYNNKNEEENMRKNKANNVPAQSNNAMGNKNNKQDVGENIIGKKKVLCAETQWRIKS